jgi:hypothetical protein
VRDIRSLAVGLLLGLALVWSGAGLLGEVQSALDGFAGRQGNALPFFWRFGTAPVERFAGVMAAARPLLPPGSIVAFASTDGPRQADFFRWRWAAYLLPEQHVVLLNDHTGRDMAGFLGFVLTYRKQAQDPTYELVAQLPGGRLYRVSHAVP